jgi:signal peptidase I
MGPKTSTAAGSAATARKGKFREYVEAFGIALIIALIVRTLLLQAFKIPSSSMENTLLIGDHIFVNKFIYGYHVPYTKGRILQFTTPQHGDIVVFVFPEDPSKDFIKRVIGVPGDVVEMRHKTVYRNGLALVEPYARYADGRGPEGYVPSRDDMPAIRVPPHKYFMLGDNRDRSYDSRFWGFVDSEALIGKALFIYFSIDWNHGGSWLEVWRWPERIRWDRIGHVLK